MSIQLNEGNFEKEIAQGLVLVDFWAAWCGPCRAQAPILEKLDQSKVKVCKVNVDENMILAQKFGIVSIPTIIVFKDGKELHKAVGMQSLDRLNALCGI